MSVRAFFNLWEDQHPLARVNILISLLALVVWGLTQLTVWIAPTVLPLDNLLRLTLIERLWEIMSTILLILLIYNALRITWKIIKRHAHFLSLGLGWGGVVLIVIPLYWTPSFLKAAIRQVMDRPYDEVFDEYQTLCNEWNTRCESNPNCTDITVREFISQGSVGGNPSPTLGIFADSTKVQVYKETSNKTVLFNFGVGEDDIDFGMACTIDGDTPPTSGRNVENYTYFHIRGNYYHFIEEK